MKPMSSRTCAAAVAGVAVGRQRPPRRGRAPPPRPSRRTPAGAARPRPGRRPASGSRTATGRRRRPAPARRRCRRGRPAGCPRRPPTSRSAAGRGPGRGCRSRAWTCPSPRRRTGPVTTPSGIATSSPREVVRGRAGGRRAPPVGSRRARWRLAARRPATSARTVAVAARRTAAAGPDASSRPPPSPAPGPSTTSRSARPTSRGSWSTRTTVLPASRRSASASASASTSRGWRPRIGSSRRTVDAGQLRAQQRRELDPLRLAGRQRPRQPVEVEVAEPDPLEEPRAAAGRPSATGAAQCGASPGSSTAVERPLATSQTGRRWRSRRFIARRAARRGTPAAAGRRRTPGRPCGRCTGRRGPSRRRSRRTPRQWSVCGAALPPRHLEVLLAPQEHVPGGVAHLPRTASRTDRSRTSRRGRSPSPGRGSAASQ